MPAPLNFAEVHEGLMDALDGKGYTGPQIEYTAGSLPATTPEPHVRLDPGYMTEDDDLKDIVFQCAIQVGIEQGWRMAVRNLEQPRRYLDSALEEQDPDLVRSEIKSACTLLDLLSQS